MGRIHLWQEREYSEHCVGTLVRHAVRLTIPSAISPLCRASGSMADRFPSLQAKILQTPSRPCSEARYTTDDLLLIPFGFPSLAALLRMRAFSFAHLRESASPHFVSSHLSIFFCPSFARRAPVSTHSVPLHSDPASLASNNSYSMNDLVCHGVRVWED